VSDFQEGAVTAQQNLVVEDLDSEVVLRAQCDRQRLTID